MAIPRICSVDGCDKAVKARGLCNAHYHRRSRHGSPLGGGTEQGAPLRFLQEAALSYEGADCLIWPYATLPNGYGHLWVDGGDILASRYVCEKAHGPAPSAGHEAAHSCGNGNGGCISPGHLSWKTRAANEADKLLHGTHNRGERHSRAKLTEGQVKEIRALRGTVTGAELAERYGISRWAIYDVLSGDNWAWLSD